MKTAVTVTRVEGAADDPTYRVVGALVRDTVPAARKLLVALTKQHRGERLTLDLGDVERVDSSGAGLCQVLYELCRSEGTDLGVSSFSDAARGALELYEVPPDPSELDAGKRPNIFLRIGDSAYGIKRGLGDLLILTADTVLLSFWGAKRTRRVRRGAMVVEANRVGVNAMPIVALICFLVGLVVALQSAAQLRQFGANIFVVDLIAVGMTREMGPLMTAIMIAGRSGAAIAAEIATMQVSEEIDALGAMGLNPTRYIVVPKFQALTLTMPALTVFANLTGIFGGFLVALLYLDISFGAYVNQLADALALKDIVTGLVKSVAFSWIIVLVAAHKGFQARGGAESVGLVTTSSVVSSIFWVIVADAGFSLLFYF